MKFTPSYIRLHREGELQRRAERLDALLTPCTLCPHFCGIDRSENQLAVCHSGSLPIVSSSCVHYGEEPALVGTNGVGNIFFGNCNLRCVYCQNHEISQNWRNERKNEVSIERLALLMIELQHRGVHSIGFVSPTHFVPQIVHAVIAAIPLGLSVPLIYNTNSYDSVEVLRLLDGVIDIYLPDIKYADNDAGYRYSKVREYVPNARASIAEMFRQVGSQLLLDGEGTVIRGLIIRHLVLPNDIARSEETLGWIATELDPRVTMSIMSQYYPVHRAATTELLDRRIRESEYLRVLRILDECGLLNGWIQHFESQNYYKPDFSDRTSPFKGRQSNVPEEELNG